MTNGILKVDKPSGPTSHDVVDRVRFLLKIRRVGHAGTLDPFASGLLLVGVGRGTRLLEYLMHKPKVYDVIMRLGLVTDTFDREGKVVEEHELTVSKDEVVRVLKGFVGEYDQVPPVYSSKKYHGKKLYELARQGKIIRMPPKKVRIDSLEVLSVDLPYVHFRTTVSEGTYIRALCRDVGWKLGCGAIAQELRRESIGEFTLSGSIDVYDEEEVKIVEENMISLEEASELLFPTIVVFDKAKEKVKNGQKLRVGDLKELDDFEKGQTVRLLDEDGNLLALAVAERKSKFIETLRNMRRDEFVMSPKKVFF